ncbi:DUF2264 domain-containing protein [Tabrizicola sp. J26]|uniref:DUF2264 domain-containing protein n=1 Tax=Alitabrizicola rongguiensis TaxID=2909234 RepID=UPI001F2845E0|nr:DUF2264 domain-containing protein [Tabrizicola rongguiensis]MCF1709922.1 DUF2264 domain-containing protein [Tabrizicola rongguiensis]
MQTPSSAWEASPTVRQLVAANPLHGNPLRCRADLARAVGDLWAPLSRIFSEDGTRLVLGVAGAKFDYEAAACEAMLRPLWGLAPLVAGGGEFADLDRMRQAILLGTTPGQPGYWGQVFPNGQIFVEMAALASAILLSPTTFWHPLPPEGQTQLAEWLAQINRHSVVDNNWLWFRVLVNLALRSIGRDWDPEATRAALDRIDHWYAGEGCFRDGKSRQIDYYTPMAFHFYGLIMAQCAGDAFPEHAARARQRARDFAGTFDYWFAPNGAAIPFGRSMTYRMAQGAFWSAAAFAGEEVLPWPRIKGLLLRHLRWWATQPIADRNGVLTVGYSYPGGMASEVYNAPGSPYWAMKPFLVLALPETHPFWQAEEEPAEALPDGTVTAPVAGMRLRRGAGDAVMLTGGQNGTHFRQKGAKYGRFAYSAAFGFSVPGEVTVPDLPDRSAVDSGLMISLDGRRWQERAGIVHAGIDRGLVWGRWQPMGRLTIDSWLDFGPEGWHFRLHRIESLWNLHVAEGGFSLDRTGDGPKLPESWRKVGPGEADLRTLSGRSILRDLGGVRAGSVVSCVPNVNIRTPRSAFPRLAGMLRPGTHWLLTAAYGAIDPAAAVPEPDLSEAMLRILAETGARAGRPAGWIPRVRAALLRAAREVREV